MNQNNIQRPQNRLSYTHVCEYIIRYENGRIRFQSHFVDKKKSGICSAWYENGQKKSEEHYVDWKTNGICMEWYKNGLITKITMFDNGKECILKKTCLQITKTILFF